MPKTVIYVTAALLLIGILPFPYGYYTLLRIVAFSVFAWAAYITFDRSIPVLPWILTILAIVFNPILKIYLPKDIWSVIDFCSAVFLILIRNKIGELKSNAT